LAATRQNGFLFEDSSRMSSYLAFVSSSLAAVQHIVGSDEIVTIFIFNLRDSIYRFPVHSHEKKRFLRSISCTGKILPHDYLEL
jgi:hypothetical protein